ncbi:replication protein A 32 kDa subunit [Ctenocephalides felis]|uniref:replication protein A 32 kDa subunit n=1 Tax=Ctenocephalides felis TaxID=7515 RepID=UPI000E6E3311|nr:replication protein A 32 kDa subunit [Ctenocephalides felis]
MDSSMNGGFNQNGDGQTPKTEEKDQTVVPLVIQQVKGWSGDSLKVWGMNVNIVKLVGVVKNIENSSTKITYTIEDHTGTIDCYYWLEENNTKSLSNIMMNTYVEVFGNARKNQGSSLIMLFNINPLTSFNQVTTHLLEVLHARYQAEQWHKNGEGGNESMNKGGPFNNSTLESSISGMRAGSLNQQQQNLYEAIRSFPYPEGISTKQLLEKFPSISQGELVKITDFLCNEGHIYTSIDADHFLSTDI